MLSQPHRSGEAPARGDIVAGKYRLERVIGAGGMGIVFKAEHLELDCTVALKFMHSNVVQDPQMRARFLREARAVSKLRTDHVAQVRDVGWLDEWTPYLVMEYLEGMDLSSVLARRGAVGPAEAATYVLQACRALAEAHAHSVVHRDIKPANLFLTTRADGSCLIKVLDFGIAKLGIVEANSDTIQTNGVLASVPYAAPEQLTSDGTIGTATDLYALGVVFYELLTGALPYRMSAVMNLVSDILAGALVPLLERRPSLPESLDRVVARCLARQPEDRWESALALAAALEPFAEGFTGAPPALTGTITPARGFVPEGSGRQHDGVSSEVLSPRTEPARALAYVSQARSQPDCCDSHATLEDATLRVRLLHLHLDVELTSNPDSIRAAADRLAQQLRRACSGVRFIAFVGTRESLVIVKHMLRLDLEQLEATASEREVFREALLFRVDDLLEIAGDAGQEELDPARAAELLRVARGFEELLERLGRRAPLPFPREQAPGNVEETQVVPDDRMAPLTARAQRYTSGLRQALQLSANRENADLFVARETMMRVREFNRTAAVDALIERAEGAGSNPLSKGIGYADTQRGVYDRLLAALQVGSTDRWVVTGQAGVGKSTVLTSLAADLASRHHEQPATAPLPLVFLLQLINLSQHDQTELANRAPGHRGAALFSALLARWCTWAEGVATTPLLTPENVTLRLRFRDTLLVLDGVDEFLTNNPSVALADFHDLLAYVQTTVGERSRIVLLLGIRASFPGLQTLASSVAHVLEIQRLSVTEAKRWFPDMSGALDSIQNGEVRDLLLTPLVLRWIGPRVGHLSDAAVSSATELLEEAIEAIVQESGLAHVRDRDGGHFATEDWLSALSFIAWTFFAGFMGEVHMDALIASARDANARTLEQGIGHHCRIAHQVLEDPLTGPALLRRTIFYPTGRLSFRFVHRQWQDFLAARYFAQCVAAGWIDEIGSVGLSVPMFKMAGEWLDARGFRLHVGFAADVLNRSRERKRPLIAANFVALLASSRIPMDGPAIELVLQAVDTMMPLTRLIILNGLSYRALRNDDPAAIDLRSRLVRIFEDCLEGKFAYAGEGSVLRSIAWCHLKAFNHYFSTRAPALPWQPPAWDSSVAEQELQVVCQKTAEGVQLAPQHRSVQLAFLQAQNLVRIDPNRPISVVHYLYYLVLARHEGAHISEISAELPTVLDAKGPIGLVYAAYRPVPEVSRLFELCCRLDG